LRPQVCDVTSPYVMYEDPTPARVVDVFVSAAMIVGDVKLKCVVVKDARPVQLSPEKVHRWTLIRSARYS